ncbi:Glycosyl transferase family 2 [Brevinema andersonii]|uniref:Glycosyl transferase family 2 n=2 Tax=Brevinema andersonii TaxID=34097 RepID=A0A1I1D1P7_BREAD|nr:Glycosyl transferase family 2 [Brevinema andersonii]
MILNHFFFARSIGVLMPKIPVILLTYNAEKYLHGAIDSLLAQTFRDFEILIVDNSSKDCTLQILKTYNNLRVKIFQGT